MPRLCVWERQTPSPSYSGLPATIFSTRRISRSQSWVVRSKPSSYQYLESAEFRREIHEGFNVVENWNAANSFIHYGKGVEFTSNRLDAHAICLLALHLLHLTLVYPLSRCL